MNPLTRLLKRTHKPNGHGPGQKDSIGRENTTKQGEVD